VIFSPAIIALLVGSAFISLMLLYSSYYGGLIVAKWDLHSGSELQLEMERRTCLISTVIGYALGFQAVLLILFIYVADQLAPFFVGAMCAAGSLNVNQWGYTTMLLKVVNVLFAGVWLVVNHTDSSAFDYPLIRTKYILLMIMAPLATVETFTLSRYFFDLKPNVITSCCGTLFTPEATGAVGAVVGMPRGPVELVFYSSMAVTLGSGVYLYLKGIGAGIFSLASAFTFVASVVALVSFISPYIYELPTHHCPFCILQREYHYVGYALYIGLLVGAVCGIGTGIAAHFRNLTSLKESVPRIQRRLALASVTAYAVFLIISVCGIVFSNLKM